MLHDAARCCTMLRDRGVARMPLSHPAWRRAASIRARRVERCQPSLCGVEVFEASPKLDELIFQRTRLRRLVAGGRSLSGNHQI
jgi:hypothetical protein